MQSIKLEKALELMEKEDYKKALSEFTKIIEKAEDIYTKEKLNTFIRICKSKIDKPVTGKGADIYTNAVILLNNGSVNDSIDILNSLLKKDKENDTVLYTLSIAHMKNNDEENALNFLKKSIEINKKNIFHAMNEEALAPLTESLEQL